MDKKLIALLKAANVTHEELNSKNPQVKAEARRKLAAAYPTAYVVLEDVKGNDLTSPELVDGVKTTKAVNRNLTARAFADSAHALHNYRFVSLDNLPKIIPVAAATTAKTANRGIIGSIDANVKPAKIEPTGETTETGTEEPTELRSLDDIIDAASDMVEEVVKAGIEVVGKAAVHIIEEAVGEKTDKKKKSV